MLRFLKRRTRSSSRAAQQPVTGDRARVDAKDDRETSKEHVAGTNQESEAERMTSAAIQIRYL
jgi:hypothetical protein